MRRGFVAFCVIKSVCRGSSHCNQKTAHKQRATRGQNCRKTGLSSINGHTICRKIYTRKSSIVNMLESCSCWKIQPAAAPHPQNLKPPSTSRNLRILTRLPVPDRQTSNPHPSRRLQTRNHSGHPPNSRPPRPHCFRPPPAPLTDTVYLKTTKISCN